MGTLGESIIRRTKALTVYDCPNLDAQIAKTCPSPPQRSGFLDVSSISGS